MKQVLLALFILGASALAWSDPAQEIAQAGDAQWVQLNSELKQKGQWTELVKSSEISLNFKKYEGKVMPFPKIDFGDFITGDDGNKYYWYGEKNSLSYFVIKYDPKIQDLLYKLNNGLGNASGEYEVIGRIVDAWSWGKNGKMSIIDMEIVAMRIKGRACVTMEKGTPMLVGENILTKWLAGKADTWTAGIPQDAKTVPAGLDPESVAKWFLYYGSVKKDEGMWTKLCTVEEDAVSKKGDLLAKGRSWWGMISKAEREYYFVRVNTDRGDDTHKYFMYQIRINGQDVGVAKPLSVVKEKSGDWRVTSF